MRKLCGRRIGKGIFTWIILMLIVIGGCFFAPEEKVMAEEWETAYDFFRIYGNSVQFSPTSQSDGNIYFGTKGATSNSGIKYRTIGWKASVKDAEGNLLQDMYCKLDGNYLVCEMQTETTGYLYKLYGITLSSIRNRMTNEVRAVFEKGNCSIVFNACMVVVKDGVEQGGMTDDGPSWGSVYTTYDGIVNAQKWGEASKTALCSFFDKSVGGLYYSVELIKTQGVNSVLGAGTYCYGTYVEISAGMEQGYRFTHWAGTNVTYDNPYGFYVNGNYSWTANAAPKKTNVVFHRGFDASDSVKAIQYYIYGDINPQLVNFGWKRAGYYPLGWSENPQSTTAQYYITDMILQQWISDKYPEVNLYEVWRENEYTFIFDRNGADDGRVKSIRTTYTGSVQMPDNQFVNKNRNCSFIGWSLNPVATRGDYKEGEVIDVQDLVTSLGLEYTTGAAIYLYAIWDEEPAIQAPDLYFSLQDARQGRISEEVLAGYARAVDLEDGVIPYGRNPQNSFLLTDFDAQKFLNCTTSTEIPVTFRATDCSGNTVERSVVVHIVDTEVKDGTEEMGRPRMISRKYFQNERGDLLSEREGGIKESSKWRTNETWRCFLEEILRKAE